MSKKAYSEEEREQIRLDLLTVGLEILSQRGLKDTRLMDIIRQVGISKPFFYTYFSSLAELVIHIIDHEMKLFLRAAREEAAEPNRTLDEKIACFIDRVIHGRRHHFFVMTQEEQVWVCRHLSQEEFDAFQDGQALFYRQLLSLWNIPQEKCAPKELGNLLLSVVLIYNSAARSLPFFFSEESERTARTQTEILSRYLASLTQNTRQTGDADSQY